MPKPASAGGRLSSLKGLGVFHKNITPRPEGRGYPVSRRWRFDGSSLDASAHQRRFPESDAPLRLRFWRPRRLLSTAL